MKRTPLSRLTPLKRGGRLLRRTPLRARSRKRQQDQRTRNEMVRDELARRELCEAGARIRVYRSSELGKAWTPDPDHPKGGGYRCGGLAGDLHDPLTRARGGAFLDPENTVAVCRTCHDWIHAHPKAATYLGLLRPSS